MFQEQFTFPHCDNIDAKTLVFRVWHFDRIAVERPPIAELAIGRTGAGGVVIVLSIAGIVMFLLILTF